MTWSNLLIGLVTGSLAVAAVFALLFRDADLIVSLYLGLLAILLTVSAMLRSRGW